VEKTIWKYKLDGVECEIAMPLHAKVLSAAVQQRDICIWALVEPEQATYERHFIIIGTGHKVPDGYNIEFIDTVLVNDGEYVFHIFEVIK